MSKDPLQLLKLLKHTAPKGAFTTVELAEKLDISLINTRKLLKLAIKDGSVEAIGYIPHTNICGVSTRVPGFRLKETKN